MALKATEPKNLTKLETMQSDPKKEAEKTKKQPMPRLRGDIFVNPKTLSLQGHRLPWRQIQQLNIRQLGPLPLQLAESLLRAILTAESLPEMGGARSSLITFERLAKREIKRTTASLSGSYFETNSNVEDTRVKVDGTIPLWVSRAPTIQNPDIRPGRVEQLALLSILHGPL